MSTPPQPRAVTMQATIDRLIVAAQHAFAEHGFAGVSQDALADAALVTRGALHHHFTNKAGVFEAVVRRIDAEIAMEMQQVWTATADPWDGVRSCFHIYLDAVLRPDRMRILLRDAPAVLGMKGFDILAESGFDSLVGDLRRLISAGRITAPDAEAFAHVLNGATITLALWAADGGPDDNRHARAHAALAALFDGVSAG